MDKPEQRFKVNTRVRLHGDINPDFYDGLGRVGCEGWIRRRKRDGQGYPRVLIEWDKDHWAYNGQEDGWTWEAHLDAVEDEDMSDKIQEPEESNFEDDIKGVTEVFLKGLMQVVSKHRGASASDSDDDEENGEIDEAEWEQLATQAVEAISASPAYVIIALERLSPPGSPPMIIPRIFHASREPEYALIIQSQLAHLLATMQDETIHDVLQQRTASDES